MNQVHLRVALALVLTLFTSAAPRLLAEANYVYHERTTADPGCGGQYVPTLNPNSSQSYTLRAKVEYQFFTDRVRVYYTTDGSTPSGTFGVGAVGTLVVSGSYVCTFASGGTVDVVEAVIPPQPAGTVVKYIVSAYHSGGGAEIFANGPGAPCACGTPTSTAAQATVFEYTVPNVVISQVYGGGGNSGATYQNDFIELHNQGSTAMNLNGWSVQYAAATGTSWTPTPLGNITIAANGYLLVRQASGGAVGLPLPTADVTGTINLSATAGKVALVSSTIALSGTCPSDVTVADLVGFGSTASCSETAPAPGGDNTTSISRRNCGTTDTGNNSADFLASSPPAPRNSVSGVAAVAITCGGNITQNTDPGVCTSLVAWSTPATGSPTPDVSCKVSGGVLPINLPVSSPHAFPKGTTMITCTATNLCSASACSFSVTVNDTEAPVFNCGQNENPQCGAGWGFTFPIITDNCDGLISGSGVPISTTTNFTCGTHSFVATRIWQVTDSSANITYCTQVVTQVDFDPPTITSCPAGATVNCLGDIPAPNVALVTATDFCNDSVPVITHVSDVNNGGSPVTVTRTYKATDACNNMRTCTQVFTVMDTTPPVVTCSTNILETTTGMTPVVVNYTVTATDNCNPSPTVTCNPASGSAFPVGVTTVSCVAVADPAVNGCVVPDNGSGTANLPPVGCQYNNPTGGVFKIVDGLAPGDRVDITGVHKNFVCPVGPSAVCSFPAPTPGSVCYQPGGSLSGQQYCADSTLEFNMAGVGTLAGFSRLINLAVSIEGHTGPRTPGQPVQSFDTDLFRLFGQVTGDPDFDLLRVVAGTDFGLPSPGHTTLRQVGGNWAVDSFFDITYRIDFVGAAGGALSGRSGSTTGTIRIQTGNPAASSACSFTVTVAPPACSPATIACPGNITQSTDAGVCNASVSWATTTGGTAPVDVLCKVSGGALPVNTLVTSPYTFPKGTTMVTCTATNLCGTNDCTFNVTVNDMQGPAINCGQNELLSCGQGWGFTVPIVIDNCDGLISGSVVAVSTGTNFLCGNTFVATRVWLATDSSGNSTTCTQINTILDFQAPAITACPADTTVACFAAVPAPNPGSVSATDNCGGAVTILHRSDVTNGMIITRTYAANDGCGNTNLTCVQTITVQEAPPLLTACPASFSLLATGPSGAVATYTDPTATDCDPAAPVVTCNPPSGSTFPVGPTVVTCSATDAALNPASCQFTITVTNTPVANTLQAQIDAAMPGDTLVVGPGTYGGVTIGKNLTLDCSGGGVVVTGASPALIVTMGMVNIVGGTYTTATDDPTVLVLGGALKLRQTLVEESTGFNQVGIVVTGTGTLDLGTGGDPGLNTNKASMAGLILSNDTATAISALGNEWRQDGTVLSDFGLIEDEIYHKLDNATKGYVQFVANNIYVTANSGSIQNGIEAATPGETVFVAAGTYAGSVTVNKAITLSGANAGQPGCMARGFESTIAGGLGTALTVASDDVTVDGFEMTGAVGISARGRIGVIVRNNKVTAGAVGIDAGTVATTASKNLSLEDNCIALTTQMAGATPTIGVFLSGVSGVQAPAVAGNEVSGGFYGYLLYDLQAAAPTFVTGGAITGVKQGVAAINVDPVTFTVYRASTFGVTNVAMSGFTGDHPASPANNFHAGVYVFTGGSDTAAAITGTLSGLTVDGTGKIGADSAGVSLADFSTGVGVRQNITVQECTIQNNLNRGVSARGSNAVAAVTRSTLAGNGGDPFGAGGNEGYGLIARNRAAVSATECYIINPAAQAGFTVRAIAADASTDPEGPTLTVSNCSIDNNGNPSGYLAQQSAGTLNASGNWWGGNVEAVIAAGIIGAADFTPFLDTGADTAGTAGFQGGFNTVHVSALGAQTGTTGRIQEGINLGGTTVNVGAGTFIEDVAVNKVITVQGAGAGLSVVSGPIGGADGATIRISAAGPVIDGFTITREGNNPTDWNNGSLNFAGVAVQGQTVFGRILNCIITGNRSGMDINNSSGNEVRNTVISNNHTGIILRNQTDNTVLTENLITDNRTVGVLFLDASGGVNSPLQQAANSQFSSNSISGNWYGDIVDRQAGGSLPAPGTSNLKNFSANWLGTTTPVVTTANSAEPGYGALIPPIFGGSAVAPGGQPNIAGAASANIDYTPLLAVGTDTSGAPGFQGDFGTLYVDAASAQTGAAGRIQEGINLAGTTVRIRSGTYAESPTTAAASVTLAPGASPGQVIINGDLTLDGTDTLEFELNGTTAGTDYDQFVVNGTVTLGGATLSLSAGFAYANCDVLTLIDNDAADAVIGQFNGLTNQATVTVGGQDFLLRYDGGSGNDVVLIKDIAPPSLLCPPSFTVTTTDPMGVSVSFSVSVGDNCDLTPTVTCVPSSGSNFPPGPTLVSCTASDDFGNVSPSCTFTVTVNRAPVARDNGAAMRDGMTASLALAKLLANDTDADGDPLTVIAVSATSTNGGAVTLGATHVTYTPLPGFIGVDRFSYTISDGRGGTATAEVEVLVTDADLPSLNSVLIQPVPGGVLLRFAGVPGYTYQLQRSEDLMTWSTIQTAVAPLHGIIEYFEPTGMPAAFYRTTEP